MTRVLVVGDLVTDIVAVHSGSIATGSDTTASISLTGGGSAANTAAWLVTSGVAAELVAVAGDDLAGDVRIAELDAAGVGRAFVRRHPGACTGSVIVLATAGERSFLCDRGANLHLRPSDVDSALAATMDAAHLHLSGYTLLDEACRAAGRHALAAARRHGLATSVDAASAAPLRRAAGFLDWISGVDLVFANLDEAGALGARDAVELAARAHADHAVVKLGAEGAVWAGPHGVVRAAARPAEVVDPTGAGDAFAAGFLAAWLGGDPDPLARGVELGAAAVQVMGGRPGGSAARAR